MKITVKNKILELTFENLHAGDCFFFIDEGKVDNIPYIKTDEEDCVNLNNGMLIHHENIPADFPVQRVKAELTIG